MDGQAQVFDRRHWTAKDGISLEALQDPEFKKLYPFESHIREIGGHNYHYLDEGEGEPVVMVHGNPTWSFFYRNLILALRSRHRCLVPDHMGCGLSEKPRKYSYTLKRHIANLERWLEELLPPVTWNGGQINLVVHDWGGPIGLGYAVRHPECIKRVVVLNTSAFTAGDMPFCIKMCRWPLLGPVLMRGFNLFATMATEKTTVKPLPKEVKDAFVMPYNSWANRIGVYNFVQDIPLERNGPTYKTLSAIDRQVGQALATVPMLIQWGMKDWCFTPYFLKLWRDRFPRAEVDEYQAGHYLLEDAGEAIAQKVTAFLERPAP